MTKFRTVLILSTAMGIATAGGSFAQDTATPTEDETVQNQENSVDSQLSLGEDVETTPIVGQPFTKGISGDWEMRCIKAEEGQEDPCQMYQLMDDGEGTPVAEFSLFRLPEGGKAVAGATVVVPLETSLQQQLRVTVDGGSVRRYPFAFCNPVGCYARIGLTAEDVAGYRRGNKATITIVPALAQDQKVELELSLTGFTAAFKDVSVVQQ